MIYFPYPEVGRQLTDSADEFPPPVSSALLSVTISARWNA